MSSLSLDAGVLPLPRPSQQPRALPRPLARPGAARRDADRAADRAEVLKALVLRARDGDPEAFGCLYDHYVELVYRYVYYRVGTHSITEDLTSETFLRALRRICDFHWQGKDFGAWLVTIARNLVADHFKSSRYRLEVCTGELVEPDRHQEGPERAVLDAMTNRTLLEAVRLLGSEQQECVVLRFLHGLSVAETALVMGKKPGAIKALQYRAVRSLGRMLPDDLRR
ncbi:sigma-70 family RNA polymerase sigma factor [Actinomadura syzygii]|uniref:Sigma-70 family RNA polymerase sigma factor n=1 Tax=Actinomadura syzygii TaxID=1427538 RepID=A0A5D0UIR6_9ACTN|nr:sigma-70 family RNA polymerase sigma factor [Actinomadura syzygii]TYC18381.1 sigma-70 family RNA polymerase sigma factor [Actinomadura syzygii]